MFIGMLSDNNYRARKVAGQEGNSDTPVLVGKVPTGFEIQT